MGIRPAHRRTLGWSAIATLAVAGLAALGGCPTVDLGDTPADIGSCRPDRQYFEDVIWPMYIDRSDDASKSCIRMSGCHNISMNPHSAMRFTTATPIDYDANYRTAARFLLCSSPVNSPMVLHPVHFASHPVTVFNVGDPEVTDVFLPWFQ